MKKSLILLLAMLIINVFICTPGFSHADGENPTRTDDSPGGAMPGSAITQGDWLNVAPQEIIKIDQFIEEKTKEINNLTEQGKKSMYDLGKLQNELKLYSQASPMAALNDSQRLDAKKNLDQLSALLAADKAPDKKDWGVLCDNFKKYDKNYANTIKGMYDMVYSPDGTVLSGSTKKFLADMIVTQKDNIDRVKTLQENIAVTTKSIESNYSQLVLLRNDLSEYENAKKYGVQQLEVYMEENPESVQKYFESKGENSPNVQSLQALIAQIKASHASVAAANQKDRTVINDPQ